MNKYKLKQSFKTRFLNVLRRFFKLPPFEKILVWLHRKNRNGIVSKLIPPNYLYNKGSIRFVKRHDINYKLDLAMLIDHAIYFDYEFTLYDPVLDLLKKTRMILDIGANTGTTSFYFTKVNPDTKIIAFEPHPEMFKRAVENMQLNNFGNIELVNIGLGEKKEEVKLCEVVEGNPGMNRILNNNSSFPYKIVHIDTLDSFLSVRNISEIDFIKIDVEGYELNVLKGSKTSIEKFKPVLFIEVDDENLKEQGADAKQLIQFLISSNYSITNAVTGEILTEASNFSNCHIDIIGRHKSGKN